MGRYFTLKNITKGHVVESYWKGDPPSIEEVQEISATLEWQEDDVIVAYSYCDLYKLVDSMWVNSTWVDIYLLETDDTEIDKTPTEPLTHFLWKDNTITPGHSLYK